MKNVKREDIVLAMVALVKIFSHIPIILLLTLTILPSLLVSKWSKMKKPEKYCWNLLVSYDQTSNAIFGGDPDETISSRVGKLKDKRWWARWISSALNYLDPGHTSETAEHDEGKDSVVE